MRGSFSSDQEALNRSLELSCEEVHKNKDKWLPFEKERESHH